MYTRVAFKAEYIKTNQHSPIVNLSIFGPIHLRIYVIVNSSFINRYGTKGKRRISVETSPIFHVTPDPFFHIGKDFLISSPQPC
jgi:hypothetical protein